MSMHVHNSLSKKLEPFVALDEARKVVTMYNCGPTVYDFAHVGNFRSFLLADSLRRFLEFKGYKVRQVMNITDVGHIIADADVGDDKVQARAKAQKKTPQEIAHYYTKAFFEDAAALNILAAMAYPRASDFINEMQKIISALLDKGHAYRVGKNIYYDVTSFARYGALSGNDIASLQAGARLEVNKEKRHPADFSLWVEDAKHVMGWRSPWGSHGYPGWHIECTAMSLNVLEHTTLDIHTGGEDNKFPHHECEIAQSEGFTGETFCRFFIHASHLLVDGKKMSKSEGNFYTVRDLFAKGYSGNAVRYFLLSGQYRQNLNLTFDGLHASEQAVRRIQECVYSLASVADLRTMGDLSDGDAMRFLKDFEVALDNDLNFPEALSAVFGYIENMNKKKLSPDEARAGLEALKKANHVLGLKLEFEITVPLTVRQLLDERQKYRNRGDFAKSDELRDAIKRLGFDVRDSTDGQVVVKTL